MLLTLLAYNEAYGCLLWMATRCMLNVFLISLNYTKALNTIFFSSSTHLYFISVAALPLLPPHGDSQVLLSILINDYF